MPCLAPCVAGAASFSSVVAAFSRLAVVGASRAAPPVGHRPCRRPAPSRARVPRRVFVVPDAQPLLVLGSAAVGRRLWPEGAAAATVLAVPCSRRSTFGVVCCCWCFLSLATAGRVGGPHGPAGYAASSVLALLCGGTSNPCGVPCEGGFRRRVSGLACPKPSIVLRAWWLRSALAGAAVTVRPRPSPPRGPVFVGSVRLVCRGVLLLFAVF